MTLQFTQNAVNRYIQFHMLDVVNPDPRDVRALLESHAHDAIKIPENRGGQTRWRIEALGCELISKHDEGLDVVVTILPPPRFRGLTPLQAEQFEAERLRTLAETVRLNAEHQRILEEERQAEASHATANQEAGTQAKEVARQERKARLDRLAELKVMTATAMCEREIFGAVLRTARHQLNRGEEIATLTRALRTSLRHLREGAQRRDGLTLDEVRHAFSQVEAVDPRLVTNAFIDGDEA